MACLEAAGIVAAAVAEDIAAVEAVGYIEAAKGAARVVVVVVVAAAFPRSRLGSFLDCRAGGLEGRVAEQWEYVGTTSLSRCSDGGRG